MTKWREYSVAELYIIIDHAGYPMWVGSSHDAEHRVKHGLWSARKNGKYPIHAWFRTLDACPEWLVWDTVPWGDRYEREAALCMQLRQKFNSVLNEFDGAQVSSAVAARISAANRGRSASPSSVEANRQSHAGKSLSADHRNAISTGLRSSQVFKAKQGSPCPPDCKCLRHVNSGGRAGSCEVGCTCGRHTRSGNRSAVRNDQGQFVKGGDA